MGCGKNLLGGHIGDEVHAFPVFLASSAPDTVFRKGPVLSNPTRRFRAPAPDPFRRERTLCPRTRSRLGSPVLFFPSCVFLRSLITKPIFFFCRLLIELDKKRRVKNGVKNLVFPILQINQAPHVAAKVIGRILPDFFPEKRKLLIPR